MALKVVDVSLSCFSPCKKKFFRCTTTYLTRRLSSAIYHYAFIWLSVIRVNDIAFSGLSKPVLVEIGPYAYSQKMERVDLQFSDDGSVLSYKIATHYYFSQGQSDPIKRLCKKQSHHFWDGLRFMFERPIVLTDFALEGTVAEWSKALHFREEGNKNNIQIPSQH